MTILRVSPVHLIAIDPWGAVTAQASDGVGIVVTDIDTTLVAKNCTDVPSLANRQRAANHLEPRRGAVLR